ncbi:HD domain-containing protein [Pseudogemmatithrix spongiicola]|uniref:HD domain-containing protein n=1 Tax=Pseudogemmatithrix spongiicola TaxID=3062599 RepID=A0AA49JRW3_9BACT|nr:HD domain-containing protein [Gemmatimonadaceae bacterium 'strain 138']WKW13729.1 HD domain-containing protein [Gemmatimonadaceae bacterium 'strain 318']
MTGYSDRINHAFAFAAKHHDREVRKGTRLPYLTQPANVALILTRYGRDEDTVVAGILHDVVEDCQREGWTREMLDERIAAKFGDASLEAALAVTRRKHDDDGIELARDDVRADCLERLAQASDAARWVFAADKVHHAGSLLADLRRTFDPEAAWGRLPGGRGAVLQWYRDALARLRALGFSAPIVDELAALVAALEER